MIVQFISAKLLDWLWRFVLNAGNLLTIFMAFILPYIVRFHFIPYLYHPYRYGGIPFTPPSFMEYQGIYYLTILGVLSGFYILSGFLNVYKFCQRPFNDSYPIILYNLTKFLFVLFICLFILFFLPLLKYPLLSTLIIVPYANDLVNGIIWSIFTMIGVTWANISTISQVCGINPMAEIF